jgi:hypothetical protein
VTAAEEPVDASAARDAREAAVEIERVLGAPGHGPGSTHEVGTWSLAYLGPGFGVQLRIARRDQGSRLEGWLSPALPLGVTLLAAPQPTGRPEPVAATTPSGTGRFEFRDPPTGPCRLAFSGPDAAFLTPPFWV